ncbi:MAG TPA: hypothetical protein VFQ78_14925 [Candidatus Udaeobacter sp.]|nr:hypothetical protein [Candidatus Udaeobacter sp.]
MKNKSSNNQEQFPMMPQSESFCLRSDSPRKRSIQTQKLTLVIAALCALFSSGELFASPYTREYDVTDFYWSSGFTDCSADVTVSLPDGAYITDVKVSGKSPRPKDKTVWLKAGATTYFRTINPPAADGTWISSPFHNFDGTSYTNATYTVTMRGFWHPLSPPGVEHVYPPHFDCGPYEDGNIKLIFDYIVY